MIPPLRTLIIVIVLMTPVDPQMAIYGMLPRPPPPVHVGVPVPMPMPVPVPVPFPVLVPNTKPATTTTTTTTQKTILGLPIPVPVPVPMQVPMHLPYSFPAFPSVVCQKVRPPGCPPCPPCLCFPSCTPAFFSFCSPCHQKCRCRSKEETPVPVPMAPPAPPPLGSLPYGVAYAAPFARPMVFMVSFPPPLLKYDSDETCRGSSSETISSETESDVTSSEWSSESSSSWETKKKKKKPKKKYLTKKMKKKRKKKKKKNIGKWHSRRNNEHSENRVKPVLSFVSRNGDVKISRSLSDAQAVQLLRGKPRNLDNPVSKRDTKYNGRRSNVKHRRRQVFLPRSLAERLGTNDMKSVVFKPPPGATISNLSMSFQISR